MNKCLMNSLMNTMNTWPCGLAVLVLLGAPCALADEKTEKTGKTAAPQGGKPPQSQSGSPARRPVRRLDQFQKASDALLEIERKARALEEESLKRRRGLEDRL